MKTLPSRRRLLPRPIRRVVSVWWFVAFLVVAGAACWFFENRSGFIVFCGFIGMVLLGVVLVGADTHRLRRIAAARSDESICTFARAFDYHDTDTAIVRAVYEELQHYFTYVTPAFPFRATDHFDTDLKLDPEDLDDISLSIAHRTRRTLDSSESNPFGHLHTIHDLVQFFAHQPASGNA